MFFSKSVKFFVLASVFVSFSASCGWFKSADANADPNPAPIAAEDFPQVAPFATREPETYQAEFIITSKIDGRDAVSKTLVAKNPSNQITTFFTEQTPDFSILKQGEKSFLLNHKTRNYAENTASPQTNFFTEEKDETKTLLSSAVLNERENARFEKLETEKKLTRYRVILNEETQSEIFVYFDEELKIPVRQEFYSIRGAEKVLSYSLEVANFKRQTEENLFAIPKDFKKVSLKEFYQAKKVKK